MNIFKLPHTIQRMLAYRRKARVRFLLSKVNVKDNMKIIDIGCGIDGRSFDDYAPADWQITGVDINPTERVRHKHPHFIYLQKDAQDLSCFNDREFDLAISIGMLEHIPDAIVFKRIVSEIRRVAKQYIVIVPYRYCWLEPHFGIPFFPLFPYSIKLALVRAFDLCSLRDTVRNDPDYLRKEFLWLSNKEYYKVFPDSMIHLTPSLEQIAIVRKCQL